MARWQVSLIIAVAVAVVALLLTVGNSPQSTLEHSQASRSSAIPQPEPHTAERTSRTPKGQTSRPASIPEVADAEDDDGWDDDSAEQLIFTGRVVHSSGAPLAKVPFSLQCRTAAIVLEDSTDDQGNFRLHENRDAFELEVREIAAARWMILPGGDGWTFRDDGIWRPAPQPAPRGNVIDFGEIVVDGALVHWSLSHPLEEATVALLCGSFSASTELGREGGLTWLFPGLYAWEAVLRNVDGAFPSTCGQLSVVDGEVRSVEVGLPQTRSVRIEVATHEGRESSGPLTIETAPVGGITRQYAWRSGDVLALDLPVGTNFRVAARCVDGWKGWANIGPQDHVVTILLDEQPSPHRQYTAYRLKGAPPRVEVDGLVQIVRLEFCLVDESGVLQSVASLDDEGDTFGEARSVPYPGAWKLLIRAVYHSGYPHDLVIPPVAFEAEAGETIELNVGQLPPPISGAGRSRVDTQLLCGAGQLWQVLVAAEYFGGLVIDSDPWAISVPPTAFVSAGARVLVKREPPDESGIQRTVADFPVRVRLHVPDAGDGLSAKLLRTAPSEEVVADLSEGRAKLWLGPGPAWLEIHRGDMRLHRQQVDVPAAGSIDVTVTVESAIVTLQPAKPQDIEWQVQAWNGDGWWESILKIRTTSTTELSAGRYRAITSDAYSHGEVVFDVQAGKELTVPLEAQRFELTFIDIPLPAGATSSRFPAFSAQVDNQTGPELVLDDSYVVWTQTQDHLRLHGLPRDHPCWVWGSIGHWMLKPTRVVADGGTSHAAEWVRLFPASTEWRLVSPTIYIQFPGSPALLELSTYAGVPEGPLSLIYEGPSSRTVVQVNEAPVTIPEILKQALKQDGQMLSKPPEPPAEDPPSY